MSALESSSVSQSEFDAAVQTVLKHSLVSGKLHIGIREALKSIDKKTAEVCLLAKNVDHADYVAVVEALCAQNEIRLVKVDDNKKLGEWCGLCKYDREGHARKVRSCGVAAISDWGCESPSRDIVISKAVQ
ncbi:hypothetical protein GJ496_005419 [Pomphorhynchus laevis]|nr:hypothetical protein GJ496_005419 [Pomphorhynchus laevis]